jgi:nucleobase:cation symporter-1, NCS1 family
MAIPNASPLLYNEDLAPAAERKWGAFSIFNVWTSDVHSLWGYYLAASLFLLCGNFVNFVLAIGLGSLVIFFLMNLVGYAGVKTGVPYPVLARASFGIWAPTFRPWCARSSPASGTARRRRRLPERSSRC